MLDDPAKSGQWLATNPTGREADLLTLTIASLIISISNESVKARDHENAKEIAIRGGCGGGSKENTRWD